MTAGLGQNPRMPDPHAPPAGNANTTLRARYNARRNRPPLLKQIWATSPWLTITSLGLRLVRALLPIVMLYIGKLIIDEAIRIVGLGMAFTDLGQAWETGALDHLLWLLALEFALAIL